MMGAAPIAILLLAGVGLLGFRVAYALRPTRMAGLIDLILPLPTARADFVATYVRGSAVLLHRGPVRGSIWFGLILSCGLGLSAWALTRVG